MDSLKLLFWDPVFSICLSAGAFVVLMFCFDRFDKPTISEDENDPWKFVAPRNLTPPRQYLLGFFVYCGTLLLVFLAISLIGPDTILKIAHGSGLQTTELKAALKDVATFPIVVAFVIVGLHPSLHLPKSFRR